MRDSLPPNGRRESVNSWGPISSRVIGVELQIPRAAVLHDLRKLVDAGRLERTTGDPNDPRTEYRVTSATGPKLVSKCDFRT